MNPKWRGKELFRIGAPPGTTSRPRGTLGPPKVHFWSQNGVPRPPGTKKASPNDPQGTPETQKYPKKISKTPKKNCKKNNQKRFQNASKSYLYKNVKNISSKPKNETAETVEIIKTIKTPRKQIKIIQEK